MVHFDLDIKACSLYVIWVKQDQIGAKIVCIPKNMHSRSPMTAGQARTPEQRQGIKRVESNENL